MPSETLRHSGSSLPNGYEFNGYRIEQLLGQGGYGFTYLVYERQLDRQAAIKELFPRQYVIRSGLSQVLPGNPADKPKFDRAKANFLEEARCLGRLHHPHIVRILGLIENQNGTVYYVMDYIEGSSFAQWMQRHRAPAESELRAILLPLLDGLEYIHAHGICHQDISPENILMTPQDRPVLIDFGSARGGPSSLTVAASQVTRAGYSAYEQYGAGAIGPYTDLYGLSGVIIHAITGQAPPPSLDRRTYPASFRPMLERYRGRYSDSFLHALDCGFSILPGDRPQSAAEFRRLLDTPISVAGLPSAPVSGRSNVWIWAGAAAAIVVAVILVVIFAFGSPSVHDNDDTTISSSSAAPPVVPDNPAPVTAQPSIPVPPVMVSARSATPSFGLASDGNSYLSRSGMTFVEIPALRKAQHWTYFCAFQTRRRDYKFYMGAPSTNFYVPNYNGASDDTFDEYPVACISHDDAADFCRIMTKAEGQPGAEFRLPSYDEWRKAAHEDSRALYPWGNAWPPIDANHHPLANLADQSLNTVPELSGKYPIIDGYNDGYPGTSPVTAFPAKTAEGLYGMGGNVEEWCGPTDFKDSEVVVVACGASWTQSDPDGARINHLHQLSPSDNARKYIGFRVVLDLPPPTPH